MIFDDVNSRSAEPDPPPPPRSRHRRSHRGSHKEEGRRRRRSTFESASKLSADTGARGDRSTAAWLWMLGVLVLATAGFAFFLQQQKAARTPLPGEAPSSRLLAFIDPVLAPLETGTGGYDAEQIAQAASQFQEERSAANLDDQEVYAAAGTVASILEEAAQDRARHLQRLADLGSPVLGLSEGATPKNPAMTENELRHLGLAVGVSWQRNSGTYRNRVEELWYRLIRLEQGRFRGGSASPAMVPEPPTTPKTDE